MSIFIIAEIGINWNGNMNLLKELILRAKDCGSDIAKTQLYDPAKLFPTKEVWIQGKNWYPRIENIKLEKEQLYQFAEWCKETEIEAMASAFDLERLGWLEEIGVKRHKIATPMNKNYDYIRALISIGKPIIASYKNESEFYYWPEYERFLGANPNQFNFLYCVPKYPTSLSELKLSEVDFNIFDGLSVHYPGIEPALMAIARGAKIIEVHFCLSRDTINNPDITSSIVPDELRELVRITRVFEEML